MRSSVPSPMSETSPVPEPSASSETPRRRGLKRNFAACERCRKRKQKCDGKLPTCSPCSSVGASCVPSNRLCRLDPTGQSEALRARVEELEAEVERLTSAHQLAQLSQLSHASPQHEGSFLAPPVSPWPSTARPSRGSSAAANHISKSSGSGDSYRGRILRPTFSGDRAQDPSFWSSPWHLWNNEVDAGESPNAANVINLPLTQYADELIEVFFTHRWPQLPVLNRGIFLREHYRPLAEGRATSELSAFLVYMVLAVASAETGPTHTRHRYSHQDLFQRAIQDLNVVLAADDLDCIECLLLLCLYGNSEPQAVNVWYTLGLALRLAIGIDLHREETTSDQQDLVRSEMAKRLFWSVYVLDRSTSIALGRPLGIQDTDISVPFPAVMTDEELCEHAESGSAPSVLATPTSQDTSTFIHIIKLRRINAAIYGALHTIAAEGTDAVQVDVIRRSHYSDLNVWLSTAPRYPPGVSMFQTTEWFQIAYHQAVLSLYRPSRALPVSSVDALRFCVDSSISLISLYGALYAKNKVSYTFVALNSLFMAAVTLLHSLRASAVVRSELTKPVVASNIESSVALLRGISYGRAVGERCANIIQRLGQATQAVFDKDGEADSAIDVEFLSWFGLRLQVGSGSAAVDNQPTALSVDTAWKDFFDDGYNLNPPGYLNLDLF